MKYKVFVSIALLFIGTKFLYSQTYSTGLLYDDIAIRKMDSIPIVAPRITRDFQQLPTAYNLLKFAPECGDQGQFGTCNGWANGYCAMTIAAAANGYIPIGTDVTTEAFSPIFVYSQIKLQKGCQTGTYLEDALRLMKKVGVPKYRDYSWKCDGDMAIPSHLFAQAKNYRIESYNLVLSPRIEKKAGLRNIKKALSENRPVVISMSLKKSFHGLKSPLWEPGANEIKIGSHAMCVIGYDDAKYGGALLIQNSWSKTWGDNGRFWIKYSAFLQQVNYAYEIYMPKYNPNHGSVTTRHQFAGTVNVMLSTGDKMKFKQKSVEKIPVFESVDSYVSGTRYRIYLSNNKPAYVYIISSDKTNSVAQVFPPNSKISASLTYSSNNIALPDEQYYIEMDNTIGLDNFCVLFSNKELNMKSLCYDIEMSRGTFPSRVFYALENDATVLTKFARDGISFNVTTEKDIVPLFFDIKHK